MHGHVASREMHSAMDRCFEKEAAAPRAGGREGQAALSKPRRWQAEGTFPIHQRTSLSFPLDASVQKGRHDSKKGGRRGTGKGKGKGDGRKAPDRSRKLTNPPSAAVRRGAGD